ncbi:hypothetical protein [Nocardia sp. KC 131]|uniref:hypothetical protein n=1 Tax=Nocardia arseniciresistens TaxID=3392119 RepID=UPI00398E7F74
MIESTLLETLTSANRDQVQQLVVGAVVAHDGKFLVHGQLPGQPSGIVTEFVHDAGSPVATRATGDRRPRRSPDR